MRVSILIALWAFIFAVFFGVILPLQQQAAEQRSIQPCLDAGRDEWWCETIWPRLQTQPTPTPW